MYIGDFSREVLEILLSHKRTVLLFMILCLFGSFTMACYRPNVYQSELTFSVDFNQIHEEKSKLDYRLQKIAKMAESEELLKPISDTDTLNMFDKDLLSEDYRGKNIRIQILDDNLDMFKIYAHGNSPEEAQRICMGVYAHFAAFSAKYNQVTLADDTTSSGKMLEFVCKNMKDARLRYVQHGNDIDNHEKFDEEAAMLYDDYVRWENLYQELLKDEFRAKWYNSWQVKIINEASMPIKPLPNRSGFIVFLGGLVGIFICILVGIGLAINNRK